MTKIKLFRLERDLKAKDLAKDLDIHPGTISTLENRKISEYCAPHEPIVPQHTSPA